MAHGIPLVNFMILPDSGRAVLHRIENAEGQVKDAKWIADLHGTVIKEVEVFVKDGTLSGIIMDNKAANRAAMEVLGSQHPTLVFLGCASHGLSLVIKHMYRSFPWLQRAYDMCNTISTSLVSSSSLRAEVHRQQLEKYGAKRAVCTAVGTRFASKHLVMRDVVRSKEALLQSSLSPTWAAAIVEKPVLKEVHAAFTEPDQEKNLWWLCEGAEELLKPVMDAIHLLEADQSLLCRMYRVLLDMEYHVNQFALLYPTLSDDSDPKSGGVATTLHKTISERFAFIKRPAMLAAHFLDPINWECKQNGLIVPRFEELKDNEYDQLDKFAAFGCTVSDELAMFKGIGIEARDVKSIMLVERKIGQLNESTRAALLASDLPAYLWPKVYMAMCHTQNIVPSCALQRELRKKKKEQQENAMKGDGGEVSTQGEQGDSATKAAADPLEVPVRDMIPYLAFHRGVTDEYFKQLVGQLKPEGTSFCVPPA